MTLNSPCKVNLLLNILGKREDGFHELETIMHPVELCDRLTIERGGAGVQLTCTDPHLPVDSRNLVHRVATLFLQGTRIKDGIRIHLEKIIPMEAGLGGGSGNAATALLGINRVFGQPLTHDQLHRLAAFLGSDIPFFLQPKPALATGRGEHIQPFDSFPALRGAAFLLVHPGFGIATSWAYQHLARFPDALNGRPGRAQRLMNLLQTADARTAGAEFYNSLEAPALEKYPLLALYQEFLRANGAAATLMSGSGSTTFAIVDNPATAEALAETFRSKFGRNCWTAVVPV
jgi:4-diphosphocytidyl-2-C-methyl-D-erythritol kinase